MDRTQRRPARALALAAAAVLVVTGPLSAQRPDFLFQRPVMTVSAFGGWSAPREQSDLFDFTRTQLTVERGDFAAPVYGAELGVRLTDRIEASLGVERMRAEQASEDREFIGSDDLPIEQINELAWTRASLTGRLYLLDTGRTIGRHAWVPNRWAPYVGGGAGLVWYTFEQHGEFVNYQTLEIVRGQLSTDGRGGSAHLLGGLDLSVSPNVVLRGEFRYYWSGARVGGSYDDFRDDIDLAGSRATLGVTFRL